MSSLRGPVLMVGAMAFFAVEDALIKTLTATLPPGEVAISLGIGGGLVFWLVMLVRGEKLLDLRALKGAVLLRNIAEMGAAMFMILSVALVPLTVVSSLLQAMPLAVTMAAAVFLGEKVGWRRWSAILVGFAGVMLILRPGSEGFDSLALIPLLTVVFLTIRDIATRRVPPGVTSLQLSCWGFLTAIPGG
ncbi:MAG: DMT family transporter, partial [Pararhodobacter sp.]